MSLNIAPVKAILTRPLSQFDPDEKGKRGRKRQDFRSVIGMGAKLKSLRDSQFALKIAQMAANDVCSSDYVKDLIINDGIDIGERRLTTKTLKNNANTLPKLYFKAHRIKLKGPNWGSLNADAISVEIYWRIVQEYALGMGLTLAQFNHLVQLVLERYDQIIASKAAAAPSGAGKGTKHRAKATSKKIKGSPNSAKSTPTKSNRSTVAPSAPIKARRSSRMLAKAAAAAAAAPPPPAAELSTEPINRRAKASRKRQELSDDDEDIYYPSFPQPTRRSSRAKRAKLGFETVAPAPVAADADAAPLYPSSPQIFTQQDMTDLLEWCDEQEQKSQLDRDNFRFWSHVEPLSEDLLQMALAAPLPEKNPMDDNNTYTLAVCYDTIQRLGLDFDEDS